MYYYIINLVIWTFSIYGFIDFIKEIWLDFICYIVQGIRVIGKALKKLLIKKQEEYIMNDSEK